MVRFETGLVGNVRKARTEALVNEKSHPRISIRETSRHGVWCHGCRGDDRAAGKRARRFAPTQAARDEATDIRKATRLRRHLVRACSQFRRPLFSFPEYRARHP